MKDRIKQIRKEAHVTQTKFAESIGLSRIMITHVETGSSKLSDRSIRDICRIYGINEEWLRTGDGEMYIPKSENEEIAVFMTKTMECDDEFKRRFIRALGRLDEDDWKLLAKIATEMTKES